MAALVGFRPLRFRAADEAERGAGELLRAEPPQRAIIAARDSGMLAQEPPGLYALELRPASGHTIRFLMGLLVPSSAPALQEAAPHVVGGASGLLPVIVPDDRGAVGDLLAAVTRGPIAWEQGVARVFRVDDRAAARAKEALEDEPARALLATSHPGPVLAAITPLNDPGLEFAPVHRGLKRRGFDEARFLAAVSEYARLYDLDKPLDTPEGLASARERLNGLASGHHALLLALSGGRGRILRFRQGIGLTQIKAAPRNPTLRSLDLALLNALVLRTVLGVADPTPGTQPDVVCVHSLEGLVGQVDAGVFQLGFGLNAPPRWEVRALIEARQSLPPQTMTAGPLPPLGLIFQA